MYTGYLYIQSIILSMCTQDLSTGSRRLFLMTSAQNLGEIKTLKIWHTNNGIGDESSWYLKRLVVVDINTDKR